MSPVAGNTDAIDVQDSERPIRRKTKVIGMGLWLVEKDRYEIVRDSDRLVTF